MGVYFEERGFGEVATDQQRIQGGQAGVQVNYRRD